MSTAARKARKRAGIKFERTAKVPTGRRRKRAPNFDYLTATPKLQAVWRGLISSLSTWR